jgi:hypothetical protein
MGSCNDDPIVLSTGVSYFNRSDDCMSDEEPFQMQHVHRGMMNMFELFYNYSIRLNPHLSSGI